MDRYKILLKKDPPPFVFVKTDECGLCCINGPCGEKVMLKEPGSQGSTCCLYRVFWGPQPDDLGAVTQTLSNLEQMSTNIKGLPI
jgi:hypothetical protein